MTRDARRASQTLFASFVHFDVSFMVWVLLGPLALFIAKDLDLSITIIGQPYTLPGSSSLSLIG